MSFEKLIAGGSGGLFVILTLLQITPIKVNPWTWIAKQLGKAINGELMNKVNDLSKQVEYMSQKHEEDAIITCRSRILRFNDECLHNERHTKSHFEQILGDITNYEHYCDEHPKFKNGITRAAIKNIKSIYQQGLQNRDFL